MIKIKRETTWLLVGFHKATQMDLFLHKEHCWENLSLDITKKYKKLQKKPQKQLTNSIKRG